MIEKIKIIILFAIVGSLIFSLPIAVAIIIAIILMIFLDNFSNFTKSKIDREIIEDFFKTEKAQIPTNTLKSNSKKINIAKSKPNIITEPQSIINYLYSNNIHCFWHFTHISNLSSIKEHGILALYELKRKNIKSIYGGNELSHMLDKKRRLDKWIHLSFTKDHPMYYVKKKKLKNLIWLKIDLSILLEKEFLFSRTIANKNNSAFYKNILLIDLENMFAYDFKTRKEANKAEVLIKGKIEPKYILNFDEFKYEYFFEKDIKNKLLQIRKKIENELKIEKSTILSDEMINILIYEKITNRNIFLRKVPLYLREKINPKEADYLEQIFECIEEYS